MFEKITKFVNGSLFILKFTFTKQKGQKSGTLYKKKKVEYNKREKTLFFQRKEKINL